MQIEDYFEFLAEDDIRLKGTRIGIESVLYEYIYRQRTPENIVQAFPSLTLEAVYATILYYLRNRPMVEAYLLDWMDAASSVRETQRQVPPPVLLRLREKKAEQQRLSVAG